MAGAEKLKEKILDEARLLAQKNLSQAQKEADQIMVVARNTAEGKKSDIIEKAKREAAERKNRAISAAELDARKLRLQAKQEVIEEAFQKALDRLNTLPKEQYVDILSSLVTSMVTKGEYELLLSDNDKSRIGADLVTKVNIALKTKGLNSIVMLSSSTAVIKSGFVLKHGDIEINSSFEAVLKAQRDELEAEVVKALF